MDQNPEKSVFFHFRFKFLAITSMAFLLYVILTGASELDEFASSPQFRLMGPFFLMAGASFLIFRRVPVKCPHCFRPVSTKKDWTCCECKKNQGKQRYLIDKCIHCRQVQAVTTCDHCTKPFRL